MEQFLILLLVMNFILTAVYAIYKAVKRECAVTAVFFLFLPLLGFGIYFVPFLLSRLCGAEKYDRDSLIRRTRIERLAEHPDMDEELNVVPVEDAMAIAENKEKRALLLRQLKKDINENYRPLLAAERDEDTESVHYVAATRMEVNRVLHKRWLECFRKYEEDRTDAERCQAAFKALRELIGSQILSGREQVMYRKKYCSLIETQIQIDNTLLEGMDYEIYLIYLVDLGRFQEAERLWNEKRDLVRSEQCYRKMTELYYQQKEQEKFNTCIAELKKDRQVQLSAQGLEWLRYWSV